MPVIFDNPVRFSSRGYNCILTSLKDTCALPPEAAVAIIYYSYESDQASAGNWFITHWWDEDVLDGNGEPILIASYPYDTALLPSQKIMMAINLGPEGSNPEKYVWTGLNFGSTYFSCVGYFTYDEVVIFPEITQGVDAYEIPAKPSEGGWGSGDAVGETLQNIWDFPNMKMQDGRQPTGILIDSNRHKMVMSPASADPNDIGYEAVTGLNMSGFDANGDVWVDNYGVLKSSWMGYFTIPVRWYQLEQDILSKVVGLHAGILYSHEHPEEAEYALYEVRNSVNVDWAIYMEGQVGLHMQHFYNLQPGNYFNVIAAIDPDTHETLIHSDNGQEAQDIAYRIKGYFKRYLIEKGTPMLALDDVEMSAPELYYPPDNTGSLHIDYPVTRGAYAFSPITDMKVYLSGGAANSDPALSLGGAKSTSELQSGLHTLFQELDSVAVYVGLITYRCIYLHNTSGVYDGVGVKLWIDKDNNDISKLYIGMGDGGFNFEPLALSSESKTPDVSDFTLAMSQGSCYTLPKIPQGEYVALWVKRTYTAHTANSIAPETVSLHLAILNNKAT